MFKTIDKIYVINLAKSKDRLEKFDKQAREYGFEYERYKAVKHKIGSYGCAVSHTNIIKDAKEKGYKRILIFEDDALFLYPKEYVKEYVNKFIQKKFDIGYIGGNFAWDRENDFDPDTLDCRCLGRFAIIVNHTAYDYLINNHPTLHQFKNDRLRRGDVSYCHSPLIKKCMRYPVVGVDNKETYTYTNCEETKKPLSFGCEHYSLILSSYFKKDMVDKENIKLELVYKLFAESNRCVKYANIIKANTRDINPFDFIEVRTINMSKDLDRWLKMKEMFDKYEIKCNRFPAIRNKNGWGGSTVSHRQCVVEAKEQQKPKVLIFEDDVYFLYPKSQVWSDLRNIIGLDYDIAYLGCTLLEPAQKIPQSNNIYKVNKCWGVWAYIVDQSIYDEFIDLLPNDPTIVSREKRNISDVLVHDIILPRGRCILTPIMSSYDGYSYNWSCQRTDTQNMINSAYEKYLEK